MKLLILIVVVRTSVVVSSVDMEVVSSSRNSKSITDASEVVCGIDGPGVDFATTGDTVTIISKLVMLDVLDVDVVEGLLVKVMVDDVMELVVEVAGAAQQSREGSPAPQLSAPHTRSPAQWLSRSQSPSPALQGDASVQQEKLLLDGSHVPVIKVGVTLEVVKVKIFGNVIETIGIVGSCVVVVVVVAVVVVVFVAIILLLVLVLVVVVVVVVVVIVVLVLVDISIIVVLTVVVIGVTISVVSVFVLLVSSLAEPSNMLPLIEVTSKLSYYFVLQY